MASDTKAPSIPVMRTQPDLLRDGPTALKQEALAPHPVQTIQANHMKNQWDADQFLLERVYGSHSAWERRMERAVLSQVQRLPGIPSSHIGLDHLLGRDEKIGFEDILNLPEMRPRMPMTGVHEAVEQKLRIGKAFLFQKAVNTYSGPREERMLMTGLHTVADVYCCICHNGLGWQYLATAEESQTYKVGKVILEKVKLAKAPGWTSRPRSVDSNA